MSKVAFMRGVHRSFHSPTGALIPILCGVDLEVERGEIVAIAGESGVGKSTLLNLLGLLDRPSRGEIGLEGATVGDLSVDAVARVRNQKVGFVFQFHHLLPEFTALENVLMPARIQGRIGAAELDRGRGLLERVGLRNRAGHRPTTLSGGERQRVALARALMNGPSLLLADEPTGNLDPQTAAAVQELMVETVRSLESSVVIATHDARLSAVADREFRVEDGLLVPTR